MGAKPSKGRLNRYAVFTGDSSEDQIFCDFVAAHSKEEALEQVIAIRGQGTDGHLVAEASRPAVFSPSDLRRLARSLERATRKGLEKELSRLRRDYGMEE